MNHHDYLIWVQALPMLRLLARPVEVQLAGLAGTAQQLRVVIATLEVWLAGLAGMVQQRRALNVDRVMRRQATARQAVRQDPPCLRLPYLRLRCKDKKIRA